MDGVRGADQLVDLGRALKDAPRELRKGLLAEIRREGKPAVEDVREAARSLLPKSGGLADLVARQSYGIRTRMSGRSAGVRVTGTGRSVRGLRSVDAGRLRHPVFGNRSVWVQQSVPPGFFSNTLADDAPRFRVGVQRAMEDTAQKIARSV